jgi:membrane associated rhomboid family serine protease
MLIIPLHRKPTAANWPWLTSVLLLLNVGIYFIGQSRDARYEAMAQMQYFEVQLDQIEVPLYLQFRQSGEASELFFDFEQAQQLLQGPAWRDLLFTVINLDRRFLAALADGGSLADQRRALDPQASWATRRASVELLLDRAVTWRYALRYDWIEARRLLGSMFLHGSVGHLIGNMIFLALLGLLVEGALGGILFGLVYLLAGVGSALFSIYWRYGDAGFGVGASGAIAGLMGAYCVLWGMRKVRFFYWFFVVFNYVKAPALVLLPFWLGWEVWQLLTDTGSNVSFDAHAGGIVSGAVLALVVRALGLQRKEFLVESAGQVDEPALARNALRDELGRMDWFAARRAADRLQQLDPHSYESRLLIWRAWSTATGAPPQQHAAARAVLSALPRKVEQLEERKRIWTDYLRVSAGKPRLTREELLSLGEWFARCGELAQGLVLLRALRGQSPIAEAVCQVLLQLALERKDRDPDDFDQIAHLLEEGWPESEQAQKLRRLATL